jgi:mono/diheme cytochrome c family protein
MSSARAPLVSCSPPRSGPSRLGFVVGVALATLSGVVGLAFSDAKEARAAASDPAAVPRALTFEGRSQPARTIGLEALLRACGEQTVEVEDPYHGRRMRYRALSFRCVLDEGFAARGGAASLAGESLLLRARDGYTRPAAGSLVVDPNAHLAFGEPDLSAGPDASGSDAPRFRPIDRRQIDPAPFYLVWTGIEHGDPHEHPWPYQLVTIEIAPFEEAFPHTAPKGLPKSDPGWRGYALFQESCSACHAINGEGGKVGPDLNVPKSIVEYRPLAQIRAYVRNPEATRYTSMPAHPHLSDADLDALIAYFAAMSARKHDPRAAAGS